MKNRKREYSTAILQLDIRFLQRYGLHRSGMTGLLRWDATTTAATVAVGSTVRVALRTAHASLDGEFSVTYARTGKGPRGWWSCPACGRRCAILYLQMRFACRQCSELHYATQSAGRRRRALLKLNKLGALYGADPEFPRRPKWMRREAFERKLRQAEAAMEVACPGGLEAHLERCTR